MVPTFKPWAGVLASLLLGGSLLCHGCAGSASQTDLGSVSSAPAGSVDPVLGPQSKQAAGEQKILAVAVRFADVPPRLPLRQIRRKVVLDLDRYIREQSYGSAWLKTDLRGWVLLPRPLAKYKVSTSVFDIDKERVRRFIQDTMTAVEQEVDFAEYHHLLIVAGTTMTGRDTGYGTPCLCANPGLLSSAGEGRHPRYAILKAKGGKTFAGGILIGVENAHLGMFAHDLMHALGGIDQNKRLVP